MLLANGLLFDGGGGAPVRGSLLIEGDRIAAVGALPAVSGHEVIDCAGLAVAPGFIDLHSHSDLQVLEPERLEKVKQGVTAEVVGNCGFSPFPHSGDPAPLVEFGAGILGRKEGWGWRDAAGYLQAVERASTVGTASLAGHGSLRIAVAGPRQSALSSGELDRMEGLLEDALDAGCAGFSTGLMYAPGSSAGRDELVRLCGIVARKGKLYATHMRSYSAGLLEALHEQIGLAEATGCRLQISHLQAAGRANWAKQQRAFEEIESARARGVDIEFDIYPYQCGSTVLTQWLPHWALDGGREALLARLADAGARRRIAAEMDATRAQHWCDITISGASNPALIGKTLEQLGEARACDPAMAALDVLLEERAAVNVISFNQSEENLRALLTHPLCTVISDGFYVTGKPHPRLHGTFPELLGAVVRERGWLSLPEAIHKITAKPAARLGWTDRGMLRPGDCADVTVFDPATVAGRATYQTPEADPVGVVRVIRGGRCMFDSSNV